MRLIRQVSSPVRWEDVVKRLVAEGARTFVELGPGNVLAGLVKKIDRSVTVASVEDPAGLEAALVTVGEIPNVEPRTTNPERRTPNHEPRTRL